VRVWKRKKTVMEKKWSRGCRKMICSSFERAIIITGNRFRDAQKILFIEVEEALIKS